MKEIKLTQGKVALVDDEDYEFLNQWKWHAQKGRNTFYAARNIWHSSTENEYIYMHREILKIKDKKIFGDHRNGNGLDNQKSNLRTSSDQQNKFNMKHREGGTSKFRGVDYHHRLNKWRARINIDKKAIHIGMYISEKEAAFAYNEKAKELYGEFANLNKL